MKMTTVAWTAAHIMDATQEMNLLHGQESDVLADAAFHGLGKHTQAKASAVSTQCTTFTRQGVGSSAQLSESGHA
jgi:hypothetical protein